MSRGIALPFHDLGSQMGVSDQHHALAALPPGKKQYPLYRRLGGPQGRSGRVRKILSPPGFDPRTVQSVASRYTDCAIPARIKFFVTVQNLFVGCEGFTIIDFYNVLKCNVK